MLSREPARLEAINDLDGRVTNWWTVVRDQWEDLLTLLKRTPAVSRPHFMEAKKHENEPGLMGAYWYTLHLKWAYNNLTLDTAGMRQSWNMYNRPDRLANCNPALLDLEQLSERMQKVGIENIPAVEFLSRSAKLADSLIYVDPPYPSVKPLYRHSAVDVAELVGVLVEQEGDVAVSGYGEEWDELLIYGWSRHERGGMSGFARENQGRVEVLWTNYKPAVLL